MQTFDETAFESEVRAYEEADRRLPPPNAPVLFYGSSSIRFWPELERDFPGRPVMNRGFGGATFDDCVQLFHRLVKPYAPRVSSCTPEITIWCTGVSRTTSWTT